MIWYAFLTAVFVVLMPYIGTLVLVVIGTVVGAIYDAVIGHGTKSD